MEAGWLESVSERRNHSVQHEEEDFVEFRVNESNEGKEKTIRQLGIAWVRKQTIKSTNMIKFQNCFSYDVLLLQQITVSLKSKCAFMLGACPIEMSNI